MCIDLSLPFLQHHIQKTRMSQFVKTHLKPYSALTDFVASQPLVGKSAFVTGASRGVGLHITQALAEAGASPIGILGRDKTRLEKTKKSLESQFPRTVFKAYAADITDSGAIGELFRDFGTADILINNAGHFPDEGPFVKQDIRKWWQGFETNILGTAVVTQQYLRVLPEGKNDAVVLNVSSTAAHMRLPLIGWSGYNGSKTGQARIFENIRFEHPEVRFISIHPGKIESDGFTKSGAPEPEEGMTDGKLAGQFYVWAATEEAAFLSGRFAWAEWDIDELKAKKEVILEKDLLLLTIDGFVRGY